MIRRLVVLALLIGGELLLEPLAAPTESVIAPRSLLLFGVLLLGADTFGELAHDLRIPRIVGYVVVGLLLGPSVSGLVPHGVVEDLGMMQQLAVGLIGLLAGVELRVGDLRERWRSVLALTGGQTIFMVLLVVPAFTLLWPLLPFAGDLGRVEGALVGFLVAAMLAVNSPMVTLALLSETKAAGPLAKTTLGVVLLADVVVIVLFSIAMNLAHAGLGQGAGAGAGALLGALVREVGGSLLAGVVVGALLTLYLRIVKRELVLFAVLVVFATAAAATALHFELLLCLVVAGFWAENISPTKSEPLVLALHKASGPVFVVFFALTGAELDLLVVREVWWLVLGVAVIRGVALLVGTRLGAWLGGAEPAVAKYAWMGLVPQAGVALGFATLVAERFPGLGAGLQALTVGVITLNTSLGPILFRAALGLAGEVVEPAPLREGGEGG